MKKKGKFMKKLKMEWEENGHHDDYDQWSPTEIVKFNFVR